jgi:hypothetical protein
LQVDRWRWIKRIG